MTDESGTLEKVLEVMQEVRISVATLMRNQESLAAEVQRLGQAVGEAGAVLVQHRALILELSERAGLDESAVN